MQQRLDVGNRAVAADSANALNDFINIQKIWFPGKAAAGNFYK